VASGRNHLFTEGRSGRPEEPLTSRINEKFETEFLVKARAQGLEFDNLEEVYFDEEFCVFNE